MKDWVLTVMVVKRDSNCKHNKCGSQSGSEFLRLDEDRVVGEEHDNCCVEHGKFINQLPGIYRASGGNHIIFYFLFEKIRPNVRFGNGNYFKPLNSHRLNLAKK